MKTKLIRITTVPVSLDTLLSGQLSYMNQFYNVTAISSDLDSLKRVGKKENVAVKCVEMTRRITPFKDLLAVYKLYKYFKVEKPFIVHTHTPKAGILGMFAAKLAKVPVRLHTVAGLPLLEAQGSKRTLLNLVERFTYKFSTQVYANSFRLKEIIINEKFCVRDKIKVIGNGSSNGIDTSYFNSSHFSNYQNNILKSKLKIIEDDFVFTFVGRLVGDKGINELIKAFKELDRDNTKLLLVGAYENDLDALNACTLSEINNNKNIIFVGFQDDVRPYFAISNALVFPSYREGFPNVVLQAGAMNLPSIVSDINGCNEIIVNEENGIIIPSKNYIAILLAMQRFINEKEFFNTLKANSRNRIVENYEQSEVWDAILHEYKRFSK